jgi:hypothetical protein
LFNPSLLPKPTSKLYIRCTIRVSNFERPLGFHLQDVLEDSMNHHGFYAEFFCGELPSFCEKYLGKYYSVKISLFLFAIKRWDA